MRIVSIIFYLFLIIISVSFSALNAKSLELNLYFKTLSLSLPLLILIAFAAGLLWGLTFFIFRYMRLKMTLTRIKGQLAMSEREVKNLRSIPIQDQH
jgi:putative membrane protein